MTPAEIVRFIETRRWPLSDEKRLQAAIADELSKIGEPFAREVRVGEHDIIDFMLGSVGLEAKLKGSAHAIYRQCERYCQYDEIKQFVLATNRAMGLPTTICGKPAFVASLGRGSL